MTQNKISQILAVTVPLSLSACIYLHLTQGTGKETQIALKSLRIGIKLIILAPSVFFMVSVLFRYVGLLFCSLYISYQVFLRFILIKYSHSGLVVNGKLPILFYLQYLLSCVVFYSIFLLMDFLKKENQNHENMLGSFNGRFMGVAPNIRHLGQYFATLMGIYLILILIMSLGILYSKRRSNNQNYCRQNVFTLNATLIWGFIHFVLFSAFWFTLIMKQIHVFTVIRFFIILSHFIKSIVTIFENQRNFPELFSDTEMNNPSLNFPLANIHPRQETVMPFIPFRQNARYYSKLYLILSKII